MHKNTAPLLTIAYGLCSYTTVERSKYRLQRRRRSGVRLIGDIGRRKVREAEMLYTGIQYSGDPKV